MKALACDVNNSYFFCSANKKELEEQLIPLRKKLEKDYQNDFRPHFFVSSEDTMKRELEKQAKIKANPYQARTLTFYVYIGEIPDADIYFCVNRELTELYFIPFDIIHPRYWGAMDPFSALDKFEFKKILQLTQKPMTYKGKKKSPNEIIGNDPFIMTDLRDKVKEWSEQGKEYVFKKVFPFFQSYNIHVDAMQELFYIAGFGMKKEFYEMDSMHMHTAFDYLHPLVMIENRTLEEEKKHASQILDEDCIEEMERQVILDYLDEVITWEIVRDIIGNDHVSGYDNMKEETRRKTLWYEIFNTKDTYK